MELNPDRSFFHATTLDRLVRAVLVAPGLARMRLLFSRTVDLVRSIRIWVFSKVTIIMQVREGVARRPQVDRVRLRPDKFDLVLDDLVAWPDSFTTVAAESLHRVLAKLALADLSIAFECATSLAIA